MHFSLLSRTSHLYFNCIKHLSSSIICWVSQAHIFQMGHFKIDFAKLSCVCRPCMFCSGHFCFAVCGLCKPDCCSFSHINIRCWVDDCVLILWLWCLPLKLFNRKKSKSFFFFPVILWDSYAKTFCKFWVPPPSTGTLCKPVPGNWLNPAHCYLK